MQTVAERLASEVVDLPVLPMTVVQVLRLTDQHTMSVRTLEEQIVRDHAMTARVLRLVNSGHNGLARRVYSVRNAIVYLGTQVIRSLALTSSVVDLFTNTTGASAKVRQMLWRSSVYSSVSAKAIARQAHYHDPEMAFIAGLLHDIGKVVLFHHMTEKYLEALDLIDKSSLPDIEAERQICGTDHTLVGRTLCDKWQLPEALVEAVSLHHRPDRAVHDRQLCAIVHTADLLAQMLILRDRQACDLSLLIEQEKSRLMRLVYALERNGVKGNELEGLIRTTSETALAMLTLDEPASDRQVQTSESFR